MNKRCTPKEKEVQNVKQQIISFHREESIFTTMLQISLHRTISIRFRFCNAFRYFETSPIENCVAFIHGEDNKRKKKQQTEQRYEPDFHR